MERMLRKRKDNSDYEIDRELTGKLAIEKNAEYQEKIEQLEEENKKLKSDLAFERTMLDNVKAEYKSLQNVIKKLKERVSGLEDVSKDYDLLSKDFIALGEENEKLKKYYDRDKEELMESCYSLAKENDKLKSDLAEDDDLREELDYRKREDKELRKWIKEHVDYQTQADFRKRFEHK